MSAKDAAADLMTHPLGGCSTARATPGEEVRAVEPRTKTHAQVAVALHNDPTIRQADADWNADYESLRARAERAERELERSHKDRAILEINLRDPAFVVVNTMRGLIAKLTTRQYVDTVGECVNGDEPQLFEIARLRELLESAERERDALVKAIDSIASAVIAADIKRRAASTASAQDTPSAST